MFDHMTMSTQTEYFVFVAILSASYLCMRFAVLWYWRSLPPKETETWDHVGKGIDAEELSGRVQHVRKEWREKKSALQSDAFKRELMVASKREQMAKLSFFQSAAPPPAEPQEPEQGFHLLMA